MLRKILKTIVGNKIYEKLKFIKLKLNKIILSIYYIGSKYKCPICKSNFRKFLPGGVDFPVILKFKVIGAGHFDNQMCPVCKSFNRDRILFLFLSKCTDIFIKPLKILHIAPEREIQKKLKLINHLDYISADIESPLADIKLDITNIPLDNETFDVIICNHVLEHIKDDNLAMAELFRVLKIGGWSILQVPISYLLNDTYEDFSITDPRDKEQHFGQNDHVRIYGKDYFKRLVNAGFIVNSINAREYLTDEEITKYGLDKNENIFYCKK